MGCQTVGHIASRAGIEYLPVLHAVRSEVVIQANEACLGQVIVEPCDHVRSIIEEDKPAFQRTGGHRPLHLRNAI